MGWWSDFQEGYTSGVYGISVYGESAVSAAGYTVGSLFTRVRTWFNLNIVSVYNALLNFIQQVNLFISQVEYQVLSLWDTLTSSIGEVTSWVTTQIDYWLDLLLSKISEIWDWVGVQINGVLTWFTSRIDSVRDWVLGQINEVRRWLLLQVDSVIKTALASLAPAINSWMWVLDQFLDFFTDPLQWLKTHFLEPIVDDFNKGFERGMKG